MTQISFYLLLMFYVYFLSFICRHSAPGSILSMIESRNLSPVWPLLTGRFHLFNYFWMHIWSIFQFHWDFRPEPMSDRITQPLPRPALLVPAVFLPGLSSQLFKYNPGNKKGGKTRPPASPPATTGPNRQNTAAWVSSWDATNKQITITKNVYKN